MLERRVLVVSMPNAPDVDLNDVAPDDEDAEHRLAARGLLRMFGDGWYETTALGVLALRCCTSPGAGEDPR